MALLIKTDTKLLEVIGLSEAMAADYLEKTRQTLNKALVFAEAKDKPYFKMGELYTLISAAILLNHDFNKDSVRQYIEKSRPDLTPGQIKRGRDMVMDKLNERTEIDLRNASRMDIVLPGYRKLSRHQPELVELIGKHIEWFKNNRHGEIRVLTDRALDAALLLEDYELSPENCKSSLPAEHYINPLMLIYYKGMTTPSAYTITHNHGFVEAIEYTKENSARCFEKMLKNSAPAVVVSSKTGAI